MSIGEAAGETEAVHFVDLAPEAAESRRARQKSISPHREIRSVFFSFAYVQEVGASLAHD